MSKKNGGFFGFIKRLFGFGSGEDESSDWDLARWFDGYFDRAEIYMEKGDYNAAVRDFTAQIEKDPEFIDQYERRAAAYRFLGIDSLAEADERKAAELSAAYEETEKTF